MEGKPSQQTPRFSRFAQRFILAAAGLQTAYWLYTFRLIAMNANPMGDGLEFVAIVPFGLVFIALVAPSLLLGISGRMLPLGVILAVGGVAANVLLFLEISSELTDGGVRPLRL